MSKSLMTGHAHDDLTPDADSSAIASKLLDAFGVDQASAARVLALVAMGLRDGVYRTHPRSCSLRSRSRPCCASIRIAHQTWHSGKKHAVVPRRSGPTLLPATHA